MSGPTLILKMLATPKLAVTAISLAVMLWVTIASGCASVISNSERYYQNMPRRAINWREYFTD
jgi:hypothetical protein